MFRCTVCQKLHTSRVEYCDCGNDTFEEVAETVYPARKVISVPEILSWIFFTACIILSLYVIFFTGAKEVKKKPHQPVKASQTQSVQIPDIDKIWDNTPAASEISGGGSEMDIYKKGLQNLLYSNLETKTSESPGECEVEFRIGSDGTLTGRKLYKRQGSKAFNKIVLNMLKKTSEYKTPPVDYTGEKIKAYVYTNNDEIKIFIK